MTRSSRKTQTLEAIRDSSNLYCLRNIKKKLYAEKEQQHSSHSSQKVEIYLKGPLHESIIFLYAL